MPEQPGKRIELFNVSGASGSTGPSHSFVTSPTCHRRNHERQMAESFGRGRAPLPSLNVRLLEYGRSCPGSSSFRLLYALNRSPGSSHALSSAMRIWAASAMVDMPAVPSTAYRKRHTVD